MSRNNRSASWRNDTGAASSSFNLIRGGEEIPFDAETIINRGDLLRLTGVQRDVERAGMARRLHRAAIERDRRRLPRPRHRRRRSRSGCWRSTFGGVPLSLTASGGALIMGLVFGWLRSVYPTFGRIPEPALWVFDTVGLAVFIGVVGLTAGRRSFRPSRRPDRACWSSGSSSRSCRTSPHCCSDITS